MATTNYISLICIITTIFFASFVWADPDMLQDICVADLSSDVTVNGYACKREASADDFFFAGLAQPKSTDNIYNATVSLLSVQNVTGLNTMGLTMTRLDFAPGGLNPPHYHPRASEIFFVLKGKLDMAFITTAYKSYSKSLKSGELFVFPKGMIHYQINRSKFPVVALAFFNSQSPGVYRVANGLFASSPSVPNDVLAKALQIDINEVKKIKSSLAPLLLNLQVPDDKYVL